MLNLQAFDYYLSNRDAETLVYRGVPIGFQKILSHFIREAHPGVPLKYSFIGQDRSGKTSKIKAHAREFDVYVRSYLLR